LNLDRTLMAGLFGGIAVLYTAIVFAFFDTTDPSNQLYYLTAIGVPLAIGFFVAPRISLYVLGACVYSLDWLSEFWQLLPREATWLIDIFLILFAVRYGVTFFTAKHKFFAGEKLILLALTFVILSSLINGQGGAITVLGLRVSFRYLFLFLAAAGLHSDVTFVSRFVRFLFLIGLIQTPVILWQWQFTNWGTEDNLSGTFGQNQTAAIALFVLVLYCYMIARMFEEKRIRMTYLVAMAFMLPAPILGEAKIFFLILPLFLAFMARADFIRKPGMAILLSLLGVLMVFVADYIIVQTGFWREGRNPLTYVQRLPEIFQKESEVDQTGRIERTYRFISAVKLAAASPQEFVFGNGPGSITLSFVSANRTKKAEYFSTYGLSSSAPTIPWMLIEFGYVGTALFMLVVWYVYRRGRYLRLSEDVTIRTYGRMLEGMTFLYVAWLFYQNTWQGDQMNYIYWPLAGLLVRLSYSVEEQFALTQARERAAMLKQPGLLPSSKIRGLTPTPS